MAPTVKATHFGRHRDPMSPPAVEVTSEWGLMAEVLLVQDSMDVAGRG